MKKISKETSIAFGVVFLMSWFAATLRIASWYVLPIIVLFYISLLVVVNMQDKKFKRQRKKRSKLNFNEGAYYDEQPLESTVNFTISKDKHFNGGRYDLSIMDEPMMWKEETGTGVTVEDIRKWKKELEDAGIPTRQVGEITVTEYDEEHYQLSGGAHGIVPKDLWHEALMKSAHFQPVSYKAKSPL